MIKVENLTKRYVGKPAIEDISFEVGKGEIVGFLGPNGAGKTTTLRILTGYMPPTMGAASIAGFDVFKDSRKARLHVGYMPENVPIYEDMKVKEYLRFRGALHGMGGKKLRIAVGEVMDLCGVNEVRKKMISSLSKGFRQRVGLADAMVHKPDLLILDEPTNGLDPIQVRQVRDLIRHLGEKHTILISTHILTEVEMTCGRVIIINRGKIQASDTPSNLVRRLRTAGIVDVEVKADLEKASKAVKEIQGVKQVSDSAELENGWCHLTLRVEANNDVREKIATVVAKNHWSLRELGRRTATLEDAFVEVTQGD